MSVDIKTSKGKGGKGKDGKGEDGKGGKGGKSGKGGKGGKGKWGEGGNAKKSRAPTLAAPPGALLWKKRHEFFLPEWKTANATINFEKGYAELIKSGLFTDARLDEFGTCLVLKSSYGISHFYFLGNGEYLEHTAKNEVKHFVSQIYESDSVGDNCTDHKCGIANNGQEPEKKENPMHKLKKVLQNLNELEQDKVRHDLDLENLEKKLQDLEEKNLKKLEKLKLAKEKLQLVNEHLEQEQLDIDLQNHKISLEQRRLNRQNPGTYHCPNY